MKTYVNATKLSEIIIPFPPLAEQKRIVAKIEELIPFVKSCRKKAPSSKMQERIKMKKFHNTMKSSGSTYE
ncbi:restriction endonuclease subunit S [Pseudoramibacter sp.]|uniref:restriction endonuclease subunit S n=1 Tax=Pseudoramibacter sp. TaxID=2034862 RepID=UPI00345AE967